MPNKFLFVFFPILIFYLINTSPALSEMNSNKNNLLTKFCLASFKSNMKVKKVRDQNEIGNFAWNCFFNKFKVGNSIKTAKTECRKETTKRFSF